MKIKFNCLKCGKVCESDNSQSKCIYCSNKCQADYQSDEKIRRWIEEGISWKTQVPQWAKRHLSETRGYKCEVCELSEWNGEKIPLECDHIDGIHSNNAYDNLRLICPNCHSQTSTYKNKNCGNGRKYRRTRYSEGLSY
jgi:rubrerythrin